MKRHLGTRLARNETGVAGVAGEGQSSLAAMNLYLISQMENTGYDTFNAAVVAAENETEARRIHPDENHKWNDFSKKWENDQGRPSSPDWLGWASTPDKVSVSLIGEAASGIDAGVVLASFQAG
jgi:hypothetical protein